MINPVLIPQPFANNGNKNTIKNTRETGQSPEDATWADGFPPVTMTPIEAGGLPPKGLDFNGIFYALSDNAVFQAKGGRYHFDATFANSIGGYPKGAILMSADDTKEFISTIANNKNNPNTNMTGWVIYAGAGLILDASTTQKGITQLNDTLTSNSVSQAATANAVKKVNDSKLNNSSPVASGSITLHEAAYPSVRLKPSAGAYGLVMESSGTQHYFAVRPVDTIFSSAGQKAIFTFPDKTGNYVIATTEDSLVFGNLGTANLNSIATYGSYGQDKNAQATTARNYPYGLAGRLDVSPGPYGVMQEYTTLDGAKAVRYASANDLSVWTPWVKLSTVVRTLSDTDNLNNIRDYGVYGQDTSVKALTTLNYPLVEAGTLEVKIGTYGLMQTYQTILGRFFLRRGQAGNTWSDWIETAQLAINNLTSDSTVHPLAAGQGKALKALIDACLPKAGPEADGSLTLNGGYPSLRLKPTTGNGLIWETQGSLYYAAIRPRDTLSSSAGEVAKFHLPASKTGDHTFVMGSDFTASLAGSGYTKLPNGLILQWGLVSMPPNSSATVTLPIACNAIMQAMATYDLPTATEFPTLATGGFTTTTMTVAVKATSGTNFGVRWFALCR